MGFRRGRTVDPHWTTAKFAGKCGHCEKNINAGERIFYYPGSRTVLCAGDDCGAQASRDLDSEKFDQAQYDSQY